MTRGISVPMLAHMAGEVTTLATCWKLTRRDTTVMAFTNNNNDIVFDSVTYKASTGFNPTTVDQKSDLSVDNMEVTGVLDSTSITEADLNAGLYDYAEVEIFLVNYLDTSMGKITVKRGWLGEVSVNQGQYTAEVRGLAQKLQTTVGEEFSPTCRASLGDGRCKFNLNGNVTSPSGIAAKQNKTVTSVTSQQIFYSSGLSNTTNFPSSFFTNGTVLFTSGLNNGLSMEVKDFSGGNITLTLPMPYTISASDAFTITVGCDKSIGLCSSRFNNVVNFRGEPYVPGYDKMLQTSGTIPDNPQV